MAKRPKPAKKAVRAKAGDMAAMRSPYPKAEAATRRPQKDDERSQPVGRKGMVKGY